MPRFFIGKENINGDSIIITGDDVDHIKKVLRLGPGDEITVCDGCSKDYYVHIETIDSGKVYAKVDNVLENKNEPPVEVVLFQGVPKSDKMDFIVQKGIELGVSVIVPVLTDRTVVKLASRKDAEHKASRWQRIALEAAKQCNRGIVPRVLAPVDFSRALKLAAESQLVVVPYEGETQTGIKSILRKNRAKKIACFIGPEGGFTQEEINEAVTSKAIPVTLGPRILRTETAGIAVVSMIMYELGDLSL